MSKWEKLLAGIDDDYLIGLSNKGVVKRAYKDKEDAISFILSEDECAEISLGDETVTLKEPLGDSKCTCPSRSICRHVILGILILKDKYAQNQMPQIIENKSDEIPKTEHKETTDAQNLTEKETSGEWQQMDLLSLGMTGSENAKAVDENKKNSGSVSAKEELAKEVLAEIQCFSVEELKKALKNQARSFVSQVKAGKKPEITYSSVVTVTLSEKGERVSLLAPIEYSACSCHKKDLCPHKAQAMLWCMLDKNMISEHELYEQMAELQDYNLEAIEDDARQMKSFITELLGTGLSRTAKDSLDYFERFAIMSHNDNLANYEGYFRAIYTLYDAYMKRSALFRIKDLIMQLMRLQRRIDILSEKAKSGKAAEVEAIAGQFRAEYVDAGELWLEGVAVEQFAAKTGYSGYTVYFIEEKTRQWYTYTYVRPQFYDNSGKRKNAQFSQAPWGVNTTLINLAGVTLQLKNARCDVRNRLSSTQETKGEIVNWQKHSPEKTEDYYYDDFSKLFEDKISMVKDWLYERKEDVQETDNLAFVQPASCQKAVFDEAEQTLFMELFDFAGRKVMVRLPYSKQEEGGISYLERIDVANPPCFFGKIYLKDGIIHMSPISVFDAGEKRPEISYRRFSGFSEEMSRQLAMELEEFENGGTGKSKAEKAAPETAIMKLADEVWKCMEDVCHSGLGSVAEYSVSELDRLKRLTGQYGMEYLSGMLGELRNILGSLRHTTDKSSMDNAERLLENIIEYVYLCGCKAGYDIAWKNYIQI